MTKKGIDLVSFIKPITEVNIGKDKVYLYSLSTNDIAVFCKLSKEDLPINRIRQFLVSLASTSIHDDLSCERIPLPTEFIEKLSDTDIELIAETYLSTPYIKHLFNKDDNLSLKREPGELASSYLDKLISAYTQHWLDKQRDISNKALYPFASLFDQVRKSSAALDSSLSLFEEYNNKLISNPKIVDQTSLHFPSPIDQHQRRVAQERADELKMVRLTGEMTSQSAKLLKDLSEAASIFLEQSEQRSIRENKTTHTQLGIAVGSVIVSAVLAAVSLYFSIQSFYQDAKSNFDNDKMQKIVIEKLDENANRAIALEHQNLKLQEQILMLKNEKQTAPKEPTSSTTKQ